MTVWLRFVRIVSGEASHLLHGTIEMLESFVKSWGSHGRVSSFLYLIWFVVVTIKLSETHN